MPEQTWELIYSFNVAGDITDQDVASVCVEIRALPGVVDVELSKTIPIPGAVDVRPDYQMVVILQNKTAVGIVQQYVEQCRDEASQLKANLYRGTHQTLQ